MRVLAIDPALRNTGYAVIEALPPPPPGSPRRNPQPSHHALTYGIIRNPPAVSQSRCLVAIRSQIASVIATFQPTVCAVEAVIYVQSFETAIILGAARGASLIAVAEADLPIHEYPPKRVKQAVVGRGDATKDQVAFMMRALLGLTETPPSDAADALAIGLTHFFTQPTATLLGQSRGEI
jgi:crossover junction endodeoxyribonuclease RuvC